MEASGHRFERIWDDFLDRFLMFFVKCGAPSGDAQIIVLYWYLQYLVAIGFLTQSKKVKNMLSKNLIQSQFGAKIFCLISLTQNNHNEQII